MHSDIRLALFAVLSALSATIGMAQSRTAPAFRSGVDLVALDVCITDRDGRFVPGLNAEDFTVFEDRMLQRLAFFSAEGDLPLVAVVLIDRSVSMWGSKLDRAKSAAVSFLQHLRAQDLAEILAFNRNAERIVPFGLDRAAAAPLIDAIVAEGETSLFDAVLVALRELQTARRSAETPVREAIVVLSDGEDTASRLAFEDVLEEVRRAGVLAYGISLRTDEHDRTLPPLQELGQLAFQTGGRAVAVRDLAVLDAVYADIAAELRHMYRLAYVPSTQTRDGRWRSVAVRVANRDVRVRTRRGYYVPRPSPSGEAFP